MERRFEYRGTILTVQFTHSDETTKGIVEGREFSGRIEQLSDHEMIVHRDGKQLRLFIAQNRDAVTFVHMAGEVFRLVPAQEDYLSSGAGDGGVSDGRLVAARPSQVIRLLVSEGDMVEKGQPILILESMKMETTQEAPFSGQVAEVNAEAGQQVDAGDIIVLLKRQEVDS
jgi:biotin carboxyl carrier protein